MNQTYVPPVLTLERLTKAQRKALLNFHNELLTEAFCDLIGALRKLDDVRTFAKRNGLYALADAMFDVHVSIGYRAYVFERLIDELRHSASSGEPTLSKEFGKQRAKIARPI